MSTINQLVRNRRVPQHRKSKSPALEGRPQLSGTILKVTVKKPCKPNSALRKVARVKLSNGKEVWAYLGGEGGGAQEHGIVLVRGGKCKDLIGVKYQVIRNVQGCDFVGDDTCKGPSKCGSLKRNQKRSRYGVRKWKNK